MGKPRKAEEAITWRGPPDLKPLLRPIADLSEDPANLNQHDERSLDAITASYARFGQQRPILCDLRGVVRAGNGQLVVAAERLGWTHIAVITTDLSGADLDGFAVADNRTQSLSSFNETALLEQLRSLQGEPDFPIAATGFNDDEIDRLARNLADAHLRSGNGSSPSFNPAGPSEQGRLDGRRETECPNCLHRFVPRLVRD